MTELYIPQKAFDEYIGIVTDTTLDFRDEVNKNEYTNMLHLLGVGDIYGSKLNSFAKDLIHSSNDTTGPWVTDSGELSDREYIHVRLVDYLLTNLLEAKPKGISTSALLDAIKCANDKYIQEHPDNIPDVYLPLILSTVENAIRKYKPDVWLAEHPQQKTLEKIVVNFT